MNSLQMAQALREETQSQIEKDCVQEYLNAVMDSTETMEWEIEELENQRPTNHGDWWIGFCAGAGLLAWGFGSPVPLIAIPIIAILMKIHFKLVNQGIDQKIKYACCRASAARSRAEARVRPKLSDATRKELGL